MHVPLTPYYVVVFDIDKTLYRNKSTDVTTKEHLRDMVLKYLKRGYGVGINTGRLWITPDIKRYLHDIYLDIDALPKGAVQTGAISSRLKLKGLKKIQQAYGGVPSSRIVFYDDKLSNIQRAHDNHYVALQVKESKPFPVFLF